MVHINDPLHVDNFYNNIRCHPNMRQKRQELILFLAKKHASVIKSGKPLAFSELEFSLTALRYNVYDYRIAFDYFFEVKQLGFNVIDNKELTTAIPRKLEIDFKIPKFIPPKYKIGISSKVFIQEVNKEKLLERLRIKNLDLESEVQWLLNQSEVNFYFKRAGKLELRDTSTWPIKSIETWPSWLRIELFGPGIDINVSYVQFLINKLNKKYHKNTLELLYPDLLQLLEDKNKWRIELCSLLQLSSEYGIPIVKKVCMAIANGSKISPEILLKRSSSVCKFLPEYTNQDIIKIGSRLQILANQFLHAKHAICSIQKISNSKNNQKQVFLNYFEWEREARYKIWNAVQQHGIMVHDGIEGIPSRFLQNLPDLIKKLGIQLS